MSRTYTNRSIQTISGYTFSFCFIFVSPIFYFMGAVSGRIEGYGEKEITKVVSHMFLLRLPRTFQHIATEEKKRDPDPNSFFFLHHFSMMKIPWHENSPMKKKELEKQQIQYKQEAIIRKTNHPSQYHRIQHCQVRRRPSSLHPLQSHFHHSLD